MNFLLLISLFAFHNKCANLIFLLKMPELSIKNRKNKICRFTPGIKYAFVHKILLSGFNSCCGEFNSISFERIPTSKILLTLNNFLITFFGFRSFIRPFFSFISKNLKARINFCISNYNIV